jgi:23S rRNA pseudouridine2605 synthase
VGHPRQSGSNKQNKSKKTGLARSLSKLGFCSRSQAAELIAAGRVRLNGTICRNPEAAVRLHADRLEVDGTPVGAAKKIYLMMNKPRGLVTTADDEKGRETVYSLLPKDFEWVAPVGRLDKASEGLLLLTNDSSWGARIADPEAHLDKSYHVQIDRVADEALLASLRRGVESDAERLAAKKASLLRSGAKNSWIEIVLDEGRNRQIRRMLEALDVEVLQLVRVAIGPLPLGTLSKGEYRNLTREEKEMMDRAMATGATKRKR